MSAIKRYHVFDLGPDAGELQYVSSGVTAQPDQPIGPSVAGPYLTLAEAEQAADEIRAGTRKPQLLDGSDEDS